MKVEGWKMKGQTDEQTDKQTFVIVVSLLWLKNLNWCKDLICIFHQIFILHTWMYDQADWQSEIVNLWVEWSSVHLKMILDANGLLKLSE